MRQRLSLFTLSLLLSWPTAAISQVRIDPPPKYAGLVKDVEQCIKQELDQKKIPAISIALVDDDKIIWAAGFGMQDPNAKTKPATASTVYRVGSVSKLFTDLAVMQLVEQGKLDLDAPITNYLPDFKPENPFGKPITLRQLMSHRSGLVREPPVGNYFDPTNPPLADTVASLNRTTLVLEPGVKSKYSNAGIATVGYVIEQTQKTPFAKYLKAKLLEPMGLHRSAFAPTPELNKDLAVGTMWTYQGREFPAPTWELGMAPAGSMYTDVIDLAKFLSILFAKGKGPNGQIVKPETLEQMYALQFAEKDAKRGIGIGFMVSELLGCRRIGHNGAIYGFATELTALPDEKLGVVVVASRDCANAVTHHLAELALVKMLNVRQGLHLGENPPTRPLEPGYARALAGRYRSGEKQIDLYERNDRLFLLPQRGGSRVELRSDGRGLLVDDRLEQGDRFLAQGEKLIFGKDTFERVAVPCPPPPPERWLGLIGEYGWDHNTLNILEKDGKLHALIEWFFLYPLTEVTPDVYKFPDFGLYHDERLVFTRDKFGKANRVVAAGVAFERRHLDGEDGKTFRIHPERPIAELRKAALAAKPPAPRGEFNKSDLVELITLDPTIKLDIRYASNDNFLSEPVYTSARAFLQRPAAEAVVRAHRELEKYGYGLMIHDGYRPWFVTKIFWDATPPKNHVFVADPSTGSRHNRGCAVDLTLFDRATGKVVPMVGGYDEMSDRSYPDYIGGTSRQRWHQELLRREMEKQGFSVYEAEWWHFDYKDWKKYSVGNQTFEELEKAGRQ